MFYNKHLLWVVPIKYVYSIYFICLFRPLYTDQCPYCWRVFDQMINVKMWIIKYSHVVGLLYPVLLLSILPWDGSTGPSLLVLVLRWTYILGNTPREGGRQTIFWWLSWQLSRANWVFLSEYIRSGRFWLSAFHSRVDPLEWSIYWGKEGRPRRHEDDWMTCMKQTKVSVPRCKGIPIKDTFGSNTK